MEQFVIDHIIEQGSAYVGAVETHGDHDRITSGLVMAKLARSEGLIPAECWSIHSVIEVSIVDATEALVEIVNPAAGDGGWGSGESLDLEEDVVEIFREGEIGDRETILPGAFAKNRRQKCPPYLHIRIDETRADPQNEGVSILAEAPERVHAEQLDNEQAAWWET